MTVVTPDRAALAEALGVAQADGWLLYDFQGVNPVLGQVLGIGGMGSRRLFVYLPLSGEPVAVAHRIELQSVALGLRFLWGALEQRRHIFPVAQFHRISAPSSTNETELWE